MKPKFCRLHSLGPRVALLIFSTVGSFSAQPAGAAPAISPAPILDKPLTPAVNDNPGEAPSSQHAWVPGHWRWNEGAYVWESGHWEIPPAANVTWHGPEWIRQTNGYVLKEGFWDDSPPPAQQVVRAAPAQPSAPQEIVVTAPPPPPQRAVIYERPSPTHIWVQGYWVWRGSRHVWVAGYWAMPPRHNVVWVPARWEMRGNRYVFVDGYWRDSVVMSAPPPPPQQVVVMSPPAQQEVVVVAAPPPPRVEVVYARPSRDHVWISGYWAWRGGRHVWIAGHYELPPRGHHTWIEPRWERRGGSYIFIEGTWGR